MKVFFVIVLICNAARVSTGQHCIKLCEFNYQEGYSQPPVSGGQQQDPPGKHRPVGQVVPERKVVSSGF